jgi:hypothetical protein
MMPCGIIRFYIESNVTIRSRDIYSLDDGFQVPRPFRGYGIEEVWPRG